MYIWGAGNFLQGYRRITARRCATQKERFVQEKLHCES